MAFQRFYDLASDKRDKILKTAMTHFATSSFKAASINRISKDAGLSAGALYYYFDNKEDLFNTLVNYAFDMTSGQSLKIEDLFQEMGYWEGISHLVYKRYQMSLAEPVMVQFIQRLLRSEDSVEMEGRTTMLRHFQEVFEYGYEHGIIRQDMPKDFLFEMHYTLMIQVNQWMLRHMTEAEDSLSEDNLEDFCNKAVGMISKAMT